MGDFGNNDFLGHQKKRNFVYKPAINLATERIHLSRNTGSDGPRIYFTKVSPRKRFKSTHDRFGKIADEMVAEEECRDLFPDAFDEELDGIEDDFEEDILTLEQIDECDRIVSHELQSQCIAPLEDVELKQTQEYISNTSPLQPLSSTVKEPDQGLHTDTRSTYNHQEDVLCTSTFTRSAGGFGSFSSRDRNVKPHTPFVSLPEENFHLKPSTSSKSYSVMMSSVGHDTNSFSAVNNITGGILGSSCSPSIRNKELSFAKPLENDHVQTLRKELEKLKSENAMAKSRVKALEEEKFSKDGEIKILRDSLEHFHAEEKRKQEEVKATQEQCAIEQSERERDLERQVQNLTTRMQFKEREILQMIEQSKKTTPLIEGSPQKKSLNLSETFPTGSSFFQKTSPEAKVKSPRGKKSTAELNIQSKASSQRLSQGEHSEAIASSGGSTASLLHKIQTQKRQTETIERNLSQCNIQFLPEVELVQRLLINKEKRLPVVNWECENSAFNENSIVPLLKLGAPFIDSDLLIQQTAFSDSTDIPHTLRLFETQASSRLQRCSKNIASDSLSHLGYDNQMVIQTLHELLNKSHTDCSLEGENDSTLLLNLQSQDHFCAATNFLPLLEFHISQYVEQRTETSDDNVVSTCLPRNSSPVESPEPKDAPGGDSEHAEKLALLQQSAIDSLKLLNILVLYSHEVRSCILKSARIVNDGNANKDEDAQRRESDDKISKAFPLKEENGTFSQHFLFPGLRNVVKKHRFPSSDNPVSSLGQLAKDDGIERTSSTSENECIHEVTQRTELLSSLFKLLVPQPKESTVVAYTTLQVLDSLARNCEGQYYTRLSPLLDDGLLSQYLSRDWCLTSLLLVTSLITPLTTRHNGGVRKLCSQTDECILLKIYQGWIYRPENVPSMYCQSVHLKIVAMVNNLLSNGHSFDMLFPVDGECQCSIELIKCLVLMLDKELSFLSPLSVERLVETKDNSYSLMLVRQGVFLLTMLCLNDRLFVDHRLEVEHQYTNVVSSITRLYKRIPHLLSDAEVLAVQDLVDFEHIDGIEWTQDSEDEGDEVIEGMDVDE